MNESLPEPATHAPPEPALPTSSLAIASLVTGILGFVLAPVVCSIAALWTGYAARKDTRSVPPRASGDGMATAGIVMGYIQLGLACAGTLCMIVYVLFFIVVFGQAGQ